MFSLIIYILLVAIGFMMGYLYKKSHTTAQFLNPDPKKAMRIFMMVFAIGTIVTLGISLFAPYALHTTNIPEEGMMKFHNAKSVMTFVTNIFFFVLVILANGYSQALKKISFVPYLMALGFYALFILADAYYISDYFSLWQKSLQLFQGNVADIRNNGWVKCALGLLVTALNALFIWWGLRK